MKPTSEDIGGRFILDGSWPVTIRGNFDPRSDLVGISFDELSTGRIYHVDRFRLSMAKKTDLVPDANPSHGEYRTGELWKIGDETRVKAFGETPLWKADPAIDSPAHYKRNGLEVFDVAEAFGLADNAYLFNVLKYIVRADHKGAPIEDLRKAAKYIEREIARRIKGEPV